MARDQSGDDSVYDFLYIDQDRVAALLVQFGSDGVLTELVRITDTGVEYGGGLSLHVAKADVKENASTSITRRFDPKLLIPLIFLDHAKDFIIEDIQTAAVGQLVMSRGKIGVSDLSVVIKLLRDPSLRRILLKRNKIDLTSLIGKLGDDSNFIEDEDLQENKEHVLDFVMNMLGILPSGIQLTQVNKKGVQIWSVLRDLGMMIAPGEIALTHGASIPGDWVIVGILDARPDDKIGEQQSEDDANPPQPASSTGTSEIGSLKLGIGLPAVIRTMLGRPASAYALTPLLIFREIKTN